MEKTQREVNKAVEEKEKKQIILFLANEISMNLFPKQNKSSKCFQFRFEKFGIQDSPSKSGIRFAKL